MKKILLLLTLTAIISCQNKPAETSKEATATATKDSIPPPSVSAALCATQGTLIEKFEQNGAKFQRLRMLNDSIEMENPQDKEWVKITLPDGSCKIVGGIGSANHYNCGFEDWNGDGMKDRVDYGKWNYSVSLFSKEKNDFSDKIDGQFNGDQWDFDKTKGLKWQFLEDKMGGTFQLYQLNGSTVKIFSEVNFSTTDDEGYAIEIRKNIVKTPDSFNSDNQKVVAKEFLLPLKEKGEEQYEAMMERWKASVKRYWDKNLNKILSEKAK